MGWSELASKGAGSVEGGTTKGSGVALVMMRRQDAQQRSWKCADLGVSFHLICRKTIEIYMPMSEHLVAAHHKGHPAKSHVEFMHDFNLASKSLYSLHGINHSAPYISNLCAIVALASKSTLIEPNTVPDSTLLLGGNCQH